MRALPYIIKKEFIQFRRTRGMIAMTLISPLFQFLILGFIVSGDVIHIPTVISDLDNSQTSRQLVSRLEHTRYLEIRSRTTDTGLADRYLVENRAIISIVIPKNFSVDAIRGLHPAILVKADAQNTNVALTGVGYVRRIAQSWFSGQSGTSLVPVALSTIGVESRIWYNPEMKNAWFMIPGIVVLLLTITTMLLTSFAIVRERETGTLEQLMVTPITRTELILGKTIPFVILGFVGLLLSLLLARLIYHIPIAGSLPLFFGLSILFILSNLGLGILISTMSHTQQQALFLTWFTMVFCLLMSGFFLPLENMPRAAYLITYIDPVRYIMIIVRELFLKGAGIADLWKETLALAGFAVVLLSAAVIRFNKRLG
jgi:ABC-2 type transport system permease protein